MAYDRYDARNRPRDERSRWRDDRSDDHGWRSEDRGRWGSDRDREDRGFFERAGDEIASWFGDDDAERRRERDRTLDEREGRYSRSYSGGSDRDHRITSHGWDRDRSDNEDRGRFWRDRSWDRGDFERGEDRSTGMARPRRDFGRDQDYRPLTGDYGRSEQFFAASGTPRRRLDQDDRFFGRSREGFHESGHDPSYSSWRQRQLDELDRDYDDYRRENQSRFEDDFSNWRNRRQEKRGMLGQIREHMEVVGSDDEHVGTVDRVAGDRIILTKSDPESGGAHHSLSCSDIDRVEGDRVILDCKGEQARDRWRDESRSRALFEREDQGEMGPRILDRSFEGTYR